MSNLKWIFSLFLLVFISTFGYSYADLQGQVELNLEKGRIFLQGGEPNRAIIYFDKVLEIEPDNVNALYYKSQALLGQELKQDASSIINQILGADSGHIGALGLKADNLLNQGEFDEALSVYEQIIEIEPDHARANVALGDDFLQNGKMDSAIKHYEKAILTDPKGKDAQGVLFADKILDIVPNHIDALIAKGTSLVLLERSQEGFTVIYAGALDAAISYFDKVLEIEPNNAEALYNKGRSFVQKGLDTTDPSSEDYQKGINLVKKAIEIDPNHVGALLYLGDRLIAADKNEEGLPYIDRALEIEPNNVDALFAKALTLAELKDYNSAVTHYNKVLEINPLHKIAAANYWYLATFVLGYVPIDGFLDVTMEDSNGFLAGHLRITKIRLMNHTQSEDFLDEWDVTGIQKRDDGDYQILQYERTLKTKIKWVNGGSEHFGISYPFERSLWRLYANYWEYNVDKGDTITFTYTVFRPL